MSPFELILTRRGVRYMGRVFPCSVGKGGTRSNKVEGDGATPRGTHRIVGCLYRPDRVKRPCDWAIPIRNGYLWSDASDQADYNQLVRAPYPFSHENMFRADPLYDIVLLTDWNWPIAESGKGSAIFLHQWRKPHHPTEGCIAFRRDHLRRITSQIRPGTKLIVP